MPLVVTTVPSGRGEMSPGPWISPMVFSVGVVAVGVGVGVGVGSGGGVTVVQAVPQVVGLGAPEVKSAALFAVLSWLALRETDVVLLVAGVGPLPAKSFAVLPKPTKSTTASVPSQFVPQVSAAVVLTSATLPAVALIAMVPVTSDGTSAVPPAPCDSRTT